MVSHRQKASADIQDIKNIFDVCGALIYNFIRKGLKHTLSDELDSYSQLGISPENKEILDKLKTLTTKHQKQISDFADFLKQKEQK